MNQNSESQIIESLNKRTVEFQRNQQLDELLQELANALGPINENLSLTFHEPKYPTLLLAGVPRSGTTVFMQTLAKTGCFAVPTNLLSRFYYAPYLGAKIQQLLTDPRFDFNGEMQEGAVTREHNSALGVGSTEQMEQRAFRYTP